MSAPNNPLLQDWTAPFGLPPFAQIEPAHFEPAFTSAMQAHRAELRAISDDPSRPDFDNTLLRFDRAGRLLDRVASVFYSLTASNTNKLLQAIQRDIAAPLSAHFSAVYMDAALFARIDAVHAAREGLGLDDEQLRLLDRVHLDFVRAGARLQGADQARYAKVMEELAGLTTRFAQNVLHDESTYQLELTGSDDLVGLPEFVVAGARQAANDRGLAQGHVITLSRSSVVPFLTFSARRDLRQQVWQAWVGRGEHEGEHDNRPIARQILQLRREQAKLHGHACYADYALADTMAGNRGAVQKLLDEVWPRALLAVEREREELRQAMDAAGASGTIEPWDWRYWAEKVRVDKYAVDDAEIKPYFALPAMVAAAFDCASRLFGLRFKARDDLPVYHPDVQAYEVIDRDGDTVGVFLHDNFARPSKRSGAWMSSLRWQSRNGEVELPIILNNNNFAKGSVGQPSLLSMDDVRTLFHEFGHGLHGLLSNVRFKRLSGTQVLRDFVELPSQIFEHWATEPEVLKRHARHVRTGEPIPGALIERLHAARRFGQGYETVRYAASAITDMAVHARSQDEAPADLSAFERETLTALGMPEGVGLNHRLVHFQHLFSSSGYAAGYYVYLWAEVLDADGYDAFTEAGSPFDSEVAQRLHRFIYSSGNSIEPGQAFRAFRGRAPQVAPLLRKRGLVDEPALV